MSLKNLHKRRNLSTQDVIATVETEGLAFSYALEGLSGAVIDGSANGLDGILSGTVTRGVAGAVNNGFEFNNGYIEVPQNPMLNISEKDIAASFWVNITSTSSWFFHKRISVNEYQLSIVNGALLFRVWNTDGTTFDLQTSGVVLNGKTHIAFYTDVANNTGQFIINGVSVTTGANGTTVKTFNTGSGNLIIGRDPWDGLYPVVGMMDEIRMWTGIVPPPEYYIGEYNNGNGITL